MNINENIQPPIDSEMAKKYSDILFVHLGEYNIEFMHCNNTDQRTFFNALMFTRFLKMLKPQT